MDRRLRPARGHVFEEEKAAFRCDNEKPQPEDKSAVHMYWQHVPIADGGGIRT